MPFLAQANRSINWSNLLPTGESLWGAYRVVGTAGQIESEELVGGTFSLKGGFWSCVTLVQTEGAPILWMERTPEDAILVCWPSPSEGWVLEKSLTIGPAATWIVETGVINDDGTTKTMEVTMPPENHIYYRLTKP
ncbi:MAG: hypothetical protein ACP5I4_10365 [Oceanipulchritudo sp.]